jgi:hypothetical protein
MCTILKYFLVLLSGEFLHILQICSQPKFINSAPTCVLSLTVHSYSPDPTCGLINEPTTIISGSGDVRNATRHFLSVAVWNFISLQHAGSTDVIRIVLQWPANHLRSDMQTEALCHPKTTVLYFNLWRTQ